jgi:EmrB/QacA subfamily drug resistance transporter
MGEIKQIKGEVMIVGSRHKAKNPQSMRGIMLSLGAVIIATFMVVLDGTAVNVALYGFVNEFHTTLSVVQWTVTGYTLAQSVVIPLTGWFSERFGYKRVFLISTALFTVSSLLCACATDVKQLIAYRIVQGLGGGMVMPVAMAFAYRISPIGKVGTVMSLLSVPTTLAPAIGPTLAGFFIEYANWNWIFMINVPIGILAILHGLRNLPDLDRHSVPELDRVGMLLAPISFAALSYGVSEGANSWTSFKTVTGIGLGAIALIIFILVEVRKRHPLLELKVFRSLDFTRGMITQWVYMFTIIAIPWIVPLYLQQVMGFSAFTAGMTLIPQTMITAIFIPIGGKCYDTFGLRHVLKVGFSLLVASFICFAWSAFERNIAGFIIALGLLGAGMGFSSTPLNAYLIQVAPLNLVSQVTSLTNSTKQLAFSLSAAGLSTVLTGFMTQTGNAASHIAFGKTFLVIAGLAIIGGLLVLSFRKLSSNNMVTAKLEQ